MSDGELKGWKGLWGVLFFKEVQYLCPIKTLSPSSAPALFPPPDASFPLVASSSPHSFDKSLIKKVYGGKGE